ncbi:MAG: class I SAM-dependent methyltransferase [Candidatus Magasanikbacteria bacterium]|nr:class I SAM-dependent methyltransferase [Candidatus Magasanikbacteria bacterium]
MATRLTSIPNTTAAYNKIAKHFANTRQKLWPELEQFKPLIKNGQYILDWGCGNGRLLALFDGKKINYFGVDISSELLKIARKNVQSSRRESVIKFFNSSKKEKKFAPERFDLIFAVASFFHLPSAPARQKQLQKFFTELKPGGKLIMTLWNLESDWAKKKRKQDWQKIGPGDYLIPWKDQSGTAQVWRYYHHFSKLEIIELLKKTGFKIEELKYFTTSEAGVNKWSDEKGGRNLVAVAVKPK